jgi:hypothetical protein
LKLSYVAVAIVLAAGALQGGIIGVSSISSPQDTYPFPLGLDNIINQSGLSANYVAGVTAFSAFALATTHDSSVSNYTGFTNTRGNYPQTIVFDFGSSQAINVLAFWAALNAGTVTQFTLYADNDGDFSNGTTSQIGSTFYTLANGSAQTASQIFYFPSVTTRYVELRTIAVAGPPQDLYPAIGEMIFAGGETAPQDNTPEPSSFGLMAAGMAGLIQLARRRGR